MIKALFIGFVGLALVQPAWATASDCDYPSNATIRMSCSVDLAAFTQAVKMKVKSDIRASESVSYSRVYVTARRRGVARIQKPYQEILADFNVSNVNSDPFHSVVITGTANPEESVERCTVPVDVTVTVVVTEANGSYQRRTTSRVELAGVYKR